MSDADDRAKGRRLQPNSPPWLSILGRHNPRQAAHTAAVLAAAGGVDGCAVCGDGPAHGYDDADPPFLPITLCVECRDTQATLFGERLTLRVDPTADAG